jgi:hypothetical protein
MLTFSLCSMTWPPPLSGEGLALSIGPNRVGDLFYLMTETDSILRNDVCLLSRIDDGQCPESLSFQLQLYYTFVRLLYNLRIQGMFSSFAGFVSTLCLVGWSENCVLINCGTSVCSGFISDWLVFVVACCSCVWWPLLRYLPVQQEDSRSEENIFTEPDWTCHCLAVTDLMCFIMQR